MPTAPGTIDLGKFRVAYPEEPGNSSDGYFLQQRASIRLNENLLKIERAEDYRVFCDAADFTSQTGKRPSPLQYFIASIGFCLFSQMARLAARLEITVHNPHLDLCMTYDLRSKPRASDFAAAAQALAYTFWIDTPAPLERMIRLAQLTDKSCHTVNTMRARVPVTARWRHNGRELDIED